MTVAATGALLLLASPALAHVEVSAKPAQAGARNAVVSFDAEGESTTAGIVGVKIQLPTGISASQVTLAGAPAGWKLTTPQGVVTIGGPALKASQNAAYSVRIAQLPPTATTLVFKTIVTYSDGNEDSWIELPAPGGEPDNPAPVLSLAPAAPTTAPATTAAPTATTAAPTTAAPTTAAPTVAAATPTPAATTSAAATSDDDGLSPALWISVGIALFAGVGGSLFAARSRPGRPGSPAGSAPGMPTGTEPGSPTGTEPEKPTGT